MRSLTLMRHAKSSWDDPDLRDFDRPLSTRGVKASALVAKHIKKKKKLVPDLILCSAAQRTRETLDLMLPFFKTAPEVKYLRSFYLASPAQLLAGIARQPAAFENILVLGHNPGLEDLALQLAGEEAKPSLRRTMREKFPTAALAHYVFEGDSWNALRSITPKLKLYWTPKALKKD